MARHCVAYVLMVCFVLPAPAWPQSDQAAPEPPVPVQTQNPPTPNATAGGDSATHTGAPAPLAEPKKSGPPETTINASATVPSTLLLEDGTPVKLRIAQTVSSADAHVGQQLDFEVLEEVRLNSVLIIPSQEARPA